MPKDLGPLSEAEWGWCFYCRREVEVRLGYLMVHYRSVLTGIHARKASCLGTGKEPSNAPQESQQDR